MADDISAHQIDRLVGAVLNMSGTMGKMYKGLQDGSLSIGDSTNLRANPQANERRRWSRLHIDALKTATDRLHRHSNVLNDTITHLKYFGEALAGVTVFSSLGMHATKLLRTFQNLNEYGQTFGGSILNMQIAAADAQLPLETFADVVTKNSEVVANLGQKRFFALDKEVRNNLLQFGMLGMTVDQVNEFFGDYAKSLRLFGNIQQFDNTKTADSFTDLLRETTALSAVTGQSRKKILETTMNAMHDASVLSQVAQLDMASKQRFTQQFGTAVAFMASQTGEAGEILSRMLTQTLGKGSAIFADDAQTFFEAGAQSLVPAFDHLAKMVRSGAASEGDLVDTLNNIKAQGEALMPTLHLQQVAGNKSADAIVRMISEMQHMSLEQVRQMRDRQSQNRMVTQLLLNLEQIFDKVWGAFRGGFLKALQGMTQWLDRPDVVANFDALANKFAQLGATIGDWLGSVLTPSNLEAIGNGIADFVNKMFAAGRGLYHAIAFASRNLGLLGTTVATIATLYLGKKLVDVFKYFRDLAGFRTFRIANAVINVGHAGAGFAGSGLVNSAPMAGMSPFARSNMTRSQRFMRSRLGMGAASAVTGLAGFAFDELAPANMPGHDTIEGMMNYGGLGAAIGSLIVPGIGTAIGAAAGAAFGAVITNKDSPFVQTLASIGEKYTSFVTGHIFSSSPRGPTAVEMALPQEHHLGPITMDDAMFKKFNGLSADEFTYQLDQLIKAQIKANDIALAQLHAQSRTANQTTDMNRKASSMVHGQ